MSESLISMVASNMNLKKWSFCDTRCHEEHSCSRSQIKHLEQAACAKRSRCMQRCTTDDARSVEMRRRGARQSPALSVPRRAACRPGAAAAPQHRRPILRRSTDSTDRHQDRCSCNILRSKSC
eukprot:4056885-Pleurochrysis_carterae.AAC.3